MTTYTYLAPKSNNEIQDRLVQWFNDNLKDPYEQSTGKRRSGFVFGDDFKLVIPFPRVHVAAGDVAREKVTVTPKTTYLEQIEHTFMIYYYNQKSHRFIFDNGAKLSDEKQCRKYLEYIQIRLKANLDNFGTYFHKAVFGTIPRPTFNTKTSTWVSMIPLTVLTYQR